jgi:hypothetical protein
MKRNATIFIIAGALLIGALAWSAFRAPGGPEMDPDARRIQREIDKANRCEETADCVQAAASVCPFGCYVHVHKDEVARIQGMLVEYQKTPREQACMYSCIEYPGVDCVKGKCVERQPGDLRAE